MEAHPRTADGADDADCNGIRALPESDDGGRRHRSCRLPGGQEAGRALMAGHHFPAGSEQHQMTGV
jgi:hypothetical protein